MSFIAVANASAVKTPDCPYYAVVAQSDCMYFFSSGVIKEYPVFSFKFFELIVQDLTGFQSE